MKRYEVLVTDAFRKKEIHSFQMKNIGIRIENNLLEIDLSQIGIDLTDLAQMLQKYQLNALEAALKLSKNCQSLKNIKTYDRNMLNDVFEKIELEKLIDQIC